MNRKERERRRKAKAMHGTHQQAPASSAGTYEDPMKTAIAYRMARYGLTEAQAKDQHAATELGRLWLRGDISEAQREAGERYLALYEDMLKAISAPSGLRKTNGTGGGGDEVSGDYITWAIGAVGKWNVFERPGFPSLRVVVLEDQPVGAMLSELRSALSILAKRFGVEAYAAAET